MGEHKDDKPKAQGMNWVRDVSRETFSTLRNNRPISLNPLDFETAVKGIMAAKPIQKPVDKSKK